MQAFSIIFFQKLILGFIVSNSIYVLTFLIVQPFMRKWTLRYTSFLWPILRMRMFSL